MKGYVDLIWVVEDKADGGVAPAGGGADRRWSQRDGRAVSSGYLGLWYSKFHVVCSYRTAVKR
jgi:hypothetical protein